MEWIKASWPWYIAGPLIGLMVPALLLLGNKTFGISATLRHICAACIPGNISFFKYDWKQESWNLFFAGGILLGGWLAMHFLTLDEPIKINPQLAASLSQYGIRPGKQIVPPELFSWSKILTVRGLVMMAGGGFLIGFGTRYAGGCTSGHSIMGLSNLQWPSLVATICFMAGGIIMANFLLPVILQL
jgi:uncharacterized membrane protein YedE/YeeE